MQSFIEEVREIMLKEMCCNAVQMDVFNSDPLITMCDNTEMTFEAQRYNVNRFWTNQLNMAPDSISIRFMLLPKGTREQWIGTFKASIIPFLLDNNLPKPITYI